MNFFEKVPTSMMAVTGVMAALGPVVFLAARGNPGMLAVWMAVYLSVGVIATLGAILFERSQKSKSRDFSKSVEQNAASTEGVRDPNKLAQIDHMRKEFQRGIDIYKRYGKDLYSLPWYVVVGEAGSGKTEALRRSEIGFPEKLQDKWQGSGGTLSMHWWFTSKAVILDTAGRLFVQDGGDVESTRAQWTSFLQMLRKNRPECPINGLILVIPATRLLASEDPEADAASLARLDQNAGQIAGQLETLQQELGIRFPVYILISKTDKITGFREFFSSIERADERYQMLGWSNPAPLGETFNPQSVADYIQSVADRLKRRMMTGLRSPVPEQGSGLRIDEVDSLFSFPAAFASMAPKLTRYLRQVFAADEWSARPPFLRGIYFTSALQQGRVLDEALARAMGIPIEEMEKDAGEDGLGLSKHRTYFIRDLFMEKIFREKGLVTRADKIRSAISGWKLWVPACFILGLGLIGLLGWLTNRPGTEQDRWNRLFAEKSDKAERLLHPVASITINNGSASGKWEENDVLKTLRELAGDVEGSPKFGWFFALARSFDRSLASDRGQAFDRVSSDVVADLVHQSHDALKSRIDTPPGPEQAMALRALLWLKHGEIREDGIELPGAEKPRNFQELFGDLVGFLGMRGTAVDEKRLEDLADLVEQSVAIRGAGFTKLLQDRMEGIDLKKMVDDSLNPVAGFDSGFAEKLNAVADLYDKVSKSLVRTGKADEKDVRKLRDDSADLIQRHDGDLSRAQQRMPTDKQEAAEDAGSKTIKALRDDVLRLQRQNVGNYNPVSTGSGVDFTTQARELLENQAALLRDIPVALGLNGTAGLTKEDSDKLSEALDDEKSPNRQLRVWWLENEFFPNKFKDYLRFPFVKDAPNGSQDEIGMLSNLIRVGGKLKNSPFPNSLTKIAEVLIDPKDSKPIKIDLIPGDAFGPGAKIRVTAVAGDKPQRFEFDNRDRGNLVPAKNVCISSAFSINVQDVALDVPGIRNEPWDMVRWYLTERPANMRNIIRIQDHEGRGINLSISRLGDLPEPEDWPSTGEF